MRPKVLYNLKRILPFGLIWLFTGWVFLLIEYWAVDSNSEIPEAAIKLNPTIFIFASLFITIVGLIVGTIEMLLVQKIFRNRSLLEKIIYKLLLYIFFLLVVISIAYPIATSIELGVSIFSAEVISRFKQFLLSTVFVSTMFQLGVHLFVSLFYAEISENIGQGVLLNFLTGKYHKPVIEKRIFMFLDMKSSTSIAEKLGHHRYFDFLRSYYESLSEPIIEHYGEVYQYIGDEIVISWRLEVGVRDAQCVLCFEAMRKALEAKASDFLSSFGIVPSFKAGIHVGEVTTGEMGALKKEIVFTGDVLNTTARIQGMCGQLNSDLLVSLELFKLFPDQMKANFELLRSFELRGRAEPIQLCAHHDHRI